MTTRDRWLARMTRALVNLAGAGSAAYFARASLAFYLDTHRLIGGLFLAEQAWFIVAFLTRRPARRRSANVVGTSAGLGSGTGVAGLVPWLLAAGGTFGGVLFRPSGAHPKWGVDAGLALQFVGVVAAIAALVALGRSFGCVAADRGPVYAAYVVIQFGYLLQSISVRNAVVLVFVTACNAGRACAEERVLAASPGYEPYRRRVPWRLIPGLW